MSLRIGAPFQISYTSPLLPLKSGKRVFVRRLVFRSFTLLLRNDRMYTLSTEYKAPYLQIGIVIRARGGSGRGSLEEGCNFFTVFGFYSAFLDENRGRFKQRSCGNRRKFENSSYHERLIIQRRKRNPGERIRGRGGGKYVGLEKPVDTEVTKPAPLKRRHLRRSQVKNPAAEDYCSRRISGMEKLRKSGKNEL